MIPYRRLTQNEIHYRYNQFLKKVDYQHKDKVTIIIQAVFNLKLT